MTKNIKKEDPPFGRTIFDHIYILTESSIIISFIYRSISITFYIIINPHFSGTDNLLKIIPVPFRISRPYFGKVPDHQRLTGLIIILLIVFSTGVFYFINTMYKHRNNFALS